MEQVSEPVADRPGRPAFPPETGILFAIVVIISIPGILSLAFLPGMATVVVFNAAGLSGLIPSGYLQLALSGVAWMAIAAAYAWWKYRAAPVREMKKDGLVPLIERAGEVEREIRALAAAAGVAKRFETRYSPTLSIETYVTGNRQANVLVVSQGFVDKFRDRPGERKAILYHELAHIANGDVDKTHLSLSLLSTVYMLLACNLAAVLLCLPFVAAGGPGAAARYSGVLAGYFGLSLFGFTVFALLGLFLRYFVAGLIRSRELYADAAAIKLSGDSTGLIKALTRFEAIGLSSGKRTGFHSKAARALSVKYHPPVAVRKEYIREPRRFFDLRPAVPAATGILTAALSYECVFFTGTLLTVLSIANPGLYGLEPLFADVIRILFYCVAGIVIATNYAPHVCHGLAGRRSWIHPVVISLVVTAAYYGTLMLTAATYYLSKLLTAGAGGDATSRAAIMDAMLSTIQGMALNAAGTFILTAIGLAAMKYMIGRLRNAMPGSAVMKKPVWSFIVMPVLLTWLPLMVTYEMIRSGDNSLSIGSVAATAILLAAVLFMARKIGRTGTADFTG
ncbi:MAG: heat shock protein HtpX [Methanocella sp. PtaU1.Bin125]|nr:MAG: heat shock protein HtpX [Methanocella sp. PtaU1.Bin125]